MSKVVLVERVSRLGVCKLATVMMIACEMVRVGASHVACSAFSTAVRVLEEALALAYDASIIVSAAMSLVRVLRRLKSC